ncbi:DUF397 domain-containing protein [Thermopolyspora sp. NPDC052614]|uniref:DUF397 domain-containing protein n=1 Tax=Thermopolyspora sp. NPDC052614 TaxID=3155682 RepID=UPI00341A7489
MNSASHPLTWRKSSHSTGTNENCVEVSSLSRGMLAMRDSKNPDGTALTFTSKEWAAFIISIKSTRYL